MTIEVPELTVALLIASSPPAAAVEIVGEFLAAEVGGRPGLVDVCTSPYVCERVHFEWEQDPHGNKCVGGVFEGV